MKKVMFSVLVLFSMISSLYATSEELVVEDNESANTEEIVLLANDEVKTYVAKNGEVFYENIDTAISEANENDTIELLADVYPEKTFYKSLTFTGKHTMTYNVYGWRFNGKLTIDGATLVLNSLENLKEANNGEAGKWFTMVLNGELTVKNSGKIEFNFDNNYGVNCAIYMSEKDTAIVNVLDNSKLHINGKNTKGIKGQAIQLGATANTGIYVKGNSELIIDGTNRGYVNSPEIYVENSTFIVKNCTGNASNGGNFTAINSTVEFLNNAGHGLSASDTKFVNTKFNSIGNGYTALNVAGNLEVIKSNLNIMNNGWHAWNVNLFSGIRLLNNATFDSDSVVTIKDNNSVGLRASNPNGNVTFAEGTLLTIINNGLLTDGSHTLYNEEKGLSFVTNGGGIWNKATMTLPSTAKIYNNHASNSADDIFNDNGLIVLGSVGTDWVLNGIQGNCTDAIDNWYDDSENSRWNAHGETEEDDYTVVVNYGKIEGYANIKAAHATQGKLVINYVDKKDNTKLLDSDENTASTGTKYTTEPKDIENYDLVEVEGETKGIYKKGTTEVTYIYERAHGKVIVHYVDMISGEKLTEDIIMNSEAGSDYETLMKDFEYYQFNRVEGSTIGKYNKETIEVTYYYEFVGGTGGNDEPEEPTNPDFPVTGVETNNTLEFTLLFSLISLIGTIVIRKKLI